jgi:hypothetical protein
VSESVIMEIAGWETDSMFRRYAIVSPADRRDAMEKLEADRARMDAEIGPRNGPFSEPATGKLQ